MFGSGPAGKQGHDCVQKRLFAEGGYSGVQARFTVIGEHLNN
jgi:hypothetical protein